jgi:sec-independent protein translocase protein TatA
MLGLGPAELIIIFVIVLVIFGVGKLPQIGDGLGKAIKGYKKAIDEDDLIDVTPKKSSEEEAKEGSKNQQQ